jgi:septum formation protein
MIKPSERQEVGGQAERSDPRLSLSEAEPASQPATAGPQVILASASPRRRELLGFLGVPFRVIATDAEEQEIVPPPEIVGLLPPLHLPVATHPTLLAWLKAAAACAEAPNGVIIGADTIVVLDGDVLGKPRDPEHARAMLRRLSGRTHTVYTGLAVLQAGKMNNLQPFNYAVPEESRRREGPVEGQDRSPISNLQLDLVASDVTIADLTDAEITGYVATGEPLDKAGSYGIQGLGGRLVRQVVGSYTCVVGLPLVAMHHLLVAAGVGGLADPAQAYRRWIDAQGKEPLPCPPTFP